MKGQISTEFMIFVTILFFILMAFLWSNQSLQNRLIGIKSNVEAQKLCDRLAFEINAAVKAGNGYERSFRVGDSFYGTSDFSISVVNYSVFIDWDDKSVASNIVIRDINGTIEKGSWNVIKNINGEVNVTQA